MALSQPILIDTDMGVDDAVAVALACYSDELQLVGLCSVGGNVPLEQATDNAARFIAALQPTQMPWLGRGLDQGGQLKDASHVFGADGLGGVSLPPADLPFLTHLELYEKLIDQHGDALTIVAIGPLTNLAAVLRERPGLLQRAGRIVIMGGAVWCPGNVTAHAEFNFYRDPVAVAEVLEAGLPITLVPLDVTRQVGMDESHAAHLLRSGSRAGTCLGRMIPFAIQRDTARAGWFLVHDAVAVGVLLWPTLFLRAHVALRVTTSGPQAGQCKPIVARQKQLAVTISVNVADFLENLLEQLCQEKFVV